MSTTSSAIPMSTASVSSSTSSQWPNNKRQRVVMNGESSSNSGLNSSASSLTTITTDWSLIFRQFECSVCLEHITPPILQCQNGHLFCQECRQKLKTPVKCPECREPLPKNNIRCHPMEQIAVNIGLWFPCKYGSSGCSVSSILTEKKNHENQCEYRPYKCWEDNECQWSGDKEQMFQHLIDVHQYVNRDLEKVNLIINLTDFSEISRCQWSESVSLGEHHFVLYLISDYDVIEDPVTYKLVLLFIGEQRIADQFKYRISMSEPSNGPRFVFEYKPHSIREDISQLLDLNNSCGIFFDDNLMKRFTKDDNFIFQLQHYRQTQQ